MEFSSASEVLLSRMLMARYIGGKSVRALVKGRARPNRFIGMKRM